MTRSTVIPLKAVKRLVKQDAAAEGPPTSARRPQTRADCIDGVRPCPWVSCRHNLYLDVTQAGGLKLHFPDKEAQEMEHSCALDVAEQGPVTLERIGGMLDLTRERVRQIESAALQRLRDTDGLEPAA